MPATEALGKSELQREVVREFELPEAKVDAARTRIFLARHGQTLLNAAGLLRGRLDPPLTPLGLVQAEALGDALGKEHARLIVASPLLRAVETAQAVAVRADLKVVVDDRFNDRDYGPWAGSSLEEVEEKWGSINDVPGVGPLDEVRDRVLTAFYDIGQRVHGDVGVIVSHDAINRLLLVALDPQLGDHSLAQGTGCYNVLEGHGVEWNVASINNIPPQK